MKCSSEFVSKNRVRVKKIKCFLRELKKLQHLLEDQVLGLSFIDRKSACCEWMKALRLEGDAGCREVLSQLRCCSYFGTQQYKWGKLW